MYDLIGNFGYMFAVAFGNPKYRLADNLDMYYYLGLSILAIFGITILIGLITLIILMRKDKGHGN